MSTRTRAITLAFIALLLAVAATSVIYGQSDSCRLTLPGDTTVSGEWTEDCDSAVSGRGHARYYTFTLPETAEVTITLSSLDADTYLYLRSEDATSGDFLHENDDHEDSRTVSQIQEILGLGTYTVEATTYESGQTGSFTLDVSGIPTVEIPTATPEPTPGAEESLSQMIDRVRPAVVKISSNQGQGSGAIFKTEGMNGYVITNQHVVENTLEVQVNVGDVDEYTGTVIGIDERRDLAVVRICCGDFPTMDFGDSLNLDVGDTVVAIGYPLDSLQPAAVIGPVRPIVPGVATVTMGIVSAFRYDTYMDADLVQTDTPINSGNSGGPLLTLDGKMVGVNTFGLIFSEGLNYAVSETTVQLRLPDLLAGNSPPQVVDEEPTISLFLLVGPDAGHIHHVPADDRIKLLFTGAPRRRDVAVSAVFTNPYTGSAFGRFDYGFMLRRNGDSNLRFYVRSDGKWTISQRKDGNSHRIAHGETGNLLRVGAGWKNSLGVMVHGDSAAFILNNSPLTNPAGDGFITLETDTGAGWTFIGSEFLNGSGKAGAITVYEDLRVWELITYGVADTADLRMLLSQLHEERSTPSGFATEEHQHQAESPD